LEEAKAALASETTNLKLRLSESEELLSVQHQQQQQQQQVQVQQQQQECARQGRERVFIEHKIAMLDQQQSAAAAAEAAAAAARGDTERAATAALERVAAVSAVFKKMANIDEGLEGDCTCLQYMQSLADPVLLQVMAALQRGT
jgi:cell division protein FtsB